MRIAVVGASGFIGQSVCRKAVRQHIDVSAIAAPRVNDAVRDVAAVAAAAEAWIGSHESIRDDLVSLLEHVDVLVNAAGLATPESDAVAPLMGANAVLPAVLAEAAVAAGVRRMVHISSAVVQGRRARLDESSVMAPVTPYSWSKAIAEMILLEQRVQVPPEVVIYRPTSVQAPNRSITTQLVRLASRRVVPVCAGGEVPLPVALIENVADGIVHVCKASSCADIVLQPSEGMTTRSLLECFGTVKLRDLPRPLVRAGTSMVYAAGHRSPRAYALARRLDLLAFGQQQEATALLSLGFSPPPGADRYRELAAQVRSGDSFVISSTVPRTEHPLG